MMLGAAVAAVSIGFASYSPARLDVVAGDTVRWSQDSVRDHTVTADDGSFDSGVLVPGDSYERPFAAAGEYAYHCRLHAGIVGEIDVHDVLLTPPALPGAPGRPYTLRGRATAGTRAVTIAGDDGSATTVAPDAAGAFAATVVPRTTTTYRAGDSPPVTVLVLDRSVAVRVAGRGARWTVATTVAPAARGATVVLQLRLRERFGWWPVAAARLGARSSALLRAVSHRRVAARVVLTLPDGATPLAFSRTFHVGRPAAR